MYKNTILCKVLVALTNHRTFLHNFEIWHYMKEKIHFHHYQKLRKIWKSYDNFYQRSWESKNAHSSESCFQAKSNICQYAKSSTKYEILVLINPGHNILSSTVSHIITTHTIKKLMAVAAILNIDIMINVYQIIKIIIWINMSSMTQETTLLSSTLSQKNPKQLYTK